MSELKGEDLKRIAVQYKKLFTDNDDLPTDAKPFEEFRDQVIDALPELLDLAKDGIRLRNFKEGVIPFLSESHTQVEWMIFMSKYFGILEITEEEERRAYGLDSNERE